MVEPWFGRFGIQRKDRTKPEFGVGSVPFSELRTLAGSKF